MQKKYSKSKNSQSGRGHAPAPGFLYSTFGMLFKKSSGGMPPSRLGFGEAVIQISETYFRHSIGG